jgi:beta-phosphoglucomutase-like phosphatase (HAD superfamily)
MVLTKEPSMWRAAMDPAIAEVIGVLSECEHLLLHFHGPVCDMPAWSGSDVTSQLHGLLAGHGVQLPPPAGAAISPYDILRFILTACPQLADRAEAQVAAYEVRAAAAARPAVGIRALLQGPAQVSIIGNACQAAIRSYLARLYPRERGRVRLVIARLGADPAILEPTSIPVLQAAQLLGVPPSACAVVASTPADIRSARLAGARAIGYACGPAARQRLTAAGAEAATASINELAGSAHLAAGLIAARRRAGGWQAWPSARR